ncbi:MAG: hypothetical protein ABFD96_02790, partial [Armatimonadia bacterium]
YASATSASQGILPALAGGAELQPAQPLFPANLPPLRRTSGILATAAVATRDDANRARLPAGREAIRNTLP